MSAGLLAEVVPEAAAEHRVAGTVEDLTALLRDRAFVVLTGAGCSTESGIPDYRGAGRPVGRQPIQHTAFVHEPVVRQRYWARATAAWERFSSARPNAAHEALATLELRGGLRGIITQNVDRLHHAAGSRRVVELHGALADVRCLTCHALEPRTALQARLLAANPAWLDRTDALAPDGDAEIPADEAREFQVPACLACGGPLTPDVVFFGGSVPRDKVEAAWSLLSEAEVLVVVGSSLTVWSGFRFVRGAAERGLPIALVNRGPTRADALSRLRVDGQAGAVLPRLADGLRVR